MISLSFGRNCARLRQRERENLRCYHRSEVKIMSFRNGDKSREHRLRKAKEKKRENVRKLVIKSDVKKQSPAASSVKK